MKHHKKIYDYLEESGVLLDGSPESIAEAKAQYWKQYRKSWKQQQRKLTKSYKIFFTLHEVKEIKTYLPNERSNITGFIKHSFLQSMRNKSTIDRKTIGLIRTLFFTAYRKLSDGEDNEFIKSLFLQLEKEVLDTLTKSTRIDN